MGAEHSLILKTDGTLWACGYNKTGQLGNGAPVDDASFGPPPTPNPVPEKIMSSVEKVAAGHYHSLMLKTDGTLWICGSNWKNQLGDGTTTSNSTPAKIMDGVKDMAAGAYHTMALKTDGTLWGMGSQRLRSAWRRQHGGLLHPKANHRKCNEC